VRQALIEEGDVFAPKRGHLSLAVPLMAPFVLAHYEQAREEADNNNILSLESMHNNADQPPAELPPAAP
jgi:hypothetical protein